MSAASPSGPGFLGIGVQKAGSTWLHVNLGAHPRIWMPPVKEINYFSQVREGKAGVADRLSQGGAEGSRYRGLFVARVLAGLRARSARSVLWDLRLFLGARNDAWYLDLFPKGQGTLAGEASPAYATIGPDGVAHVRRLLPEVKLILVLRDPIERAWSEALMQLVKLEGRSPGAISSRELESFVSRRRSLRLGGYLEILDAWSRHFAKRAFFVGFFDDLSRDPAAFLVRVQRFLGVEDPELVPPDCERRINQNVELEMPASIERRLAELYVESLRELAGRLDGPPARWLARAEAVVASR